MNAPAEKIRSEQSLKVSTGITYQSIDLFFFLAVVIQFGKVWYWPIDSEMVAVIEKPFGQFYHAVVLCVIPYALLTNKRLLDGVGKTGLLAFCVFICCVSTAWSTDKIGSAIGSLDLVSILIAAINVFTRGSKIRIINALFYTIAAIISISCLLSFLGFKPFLMQGIHDGRWRGLFPHKNNFGEFTAFSILFLICNKDALSVPRFAFYGLIVLSIVALAFVKSSTSIFILYSGLTLNLLLGGLLRRSKRQALVALIVCLLSILSGIVLLNTQFGQDLAGLLGRDMTFSGRMRIWEFYFGEAMKTPWLGRGYISLFGDEELLHLARSTLWYAVRSPHNGYIATILSIGIIGFSFYVFWVSNVILVSLKNPNPASGASVIVFSFMYLVFSFFEVSSGFLLSIGLVYMIALYVCVKVSPVPENSKRTVGRRIVRRYQ